MYACIYTRTCNEHNFHANAGTTSADVTKGRYQVRYIPTSAAAVTIFSSLVVPGGVFATYYDGVSATYHNEPLAAGKVETISSIHTPTVASAASYNYPKAPNYSCWGYSVINTLK